jgi:hypothetical protein
MAGRIFTAQNKNLLKMIYDFGGYIRITHLDCISQISHQYKWEMLNKLVEMGYLTARRFRTDSKIEPVTYQVTKPTCAMFNNPDCYFRKKHIVEYAHRALIKSYFCFENYKTLGESFITDNNDKTEFFRNAEFNEAFFPRKTNKGKSFIHFEELAIDFTGNKGNAFTNGGETLYSDDEKKIIIVFIDKYHVPVKKQIALLINRYIDLIRSGGSYRIDFLIVVDSEERKALYKKDIESFINKNVTVDRISNELMNIYWEVLYKTGDEESREELIAIRNNGYKALKERITDNSRKINSGVLTAEQINITSQVKLMGETFIKETLKANYTKYSIDEFKKFYKSFFDNLFYLEFHNHISLDKNAVRSLFDIKVYRIGCTVYD